MDIKDFDKRELLKSQRKKIVEEIKIDPGIEVLFSKFVGAKNFMIEKYTKIKKRIINQNKNIHAPIIKKKTLKDFIMTYLFIILIIVFMFLTITSLFLKIPKDEMFYSQYIASKLIKKDENRFIANLSDIINDLVYRTEELFNPNLLIPVTPIRLSFVKK